jgi:hypothetical protein
MKKVKINLLLLHHSKSQKIKSLRKLEKFSSEELNQLLEEKNKPVNSLETLTKVLMILMTMAM